MNCARWDERIALYAGGDLPAAEGAAVERHLAECPACAEFARSMTGTLAILKSTHDDEPLPLVRFVAPAARPALSLHWAWLAAATAAILAAIFFAVPRQPAPVPPPVTIVRHIPPPAFAFEIPRLIKPKPPVHHAEPVLVRIVTDNPDVVLYWIADPRGELK